MSELELRDAIAKAANAERIITDPMTIDAIDALRRDAYVKIEQTKPGQTQEREYLYLYLKAITNFEAQFAYALEEGKVARNALEDLIAKQRAKKRRQ